MTVADKNPLVFLGSTIIPNYHVLVFLSSMLGYSQLRERINKMVMQITTRQLPGADAIDHRPVSVVVLWS